jgi:large subunit ribosomal protein L29
MEARELRLISEDELGGREEELRAELTKLIMARNARRLDKPARLGQVRRDLARVLTVRAEKRRQARQGS